MSASTGDESDKLQSSTFENLSIDDETERIPDHLDKSSLECFNSETSLSSHDKAVPDSLLSLEERNLEKLKQKEKEIATSLRDEYDIDKERDADRLLALADVYSERGKITKQALQFVKAAALYNSARIRVTTETKQNHITLSIQSNEKAFLELIIKKTAEDRFCEDVLPSKLTFEHVADLKDIRNGVQKKVKKIWDKLKVEYSLDESDEERIQKEKAYTMETRQLSKEITEKMKMYIAKLATEVLSFLESPPSRYAVIGLGSLAREEMTPYSDFEFIILVENEDEGIKTFFRNFTHLLHLFILNLGETILPSEGIDSLNDFDGGDDWFYDSVACNGLSFDGAMPWACKTPLGRPDRPSKPGIELIRTPVNIAALQDKTTALKEGYHLAEILSTVTFVSGDMSLYNEYIELLDSVNNDQRKSLVFGTLIDDFQKYSGKLTLHHKNKNVSFQHVKNEIYRLPTIITNGLKLMFNVEATSPWEVVDKMFYTYEPASHHNLHFLLTLAVLIRLTTYFNNGGQQNKMSLFSAFPAESDENNQQNVPTEAVFYMDNNKLILRFYFTALPMFLFFINTLIGSIDKDIVDRARTYEKSDDPAYVAGSSDLDTKDNRSAKDTQRTTNPTSNDTETLVKQNAAENRISDNEHITDVSDNAYNISDERHCGSHGELQETRENEVNPKSNNSDEQNKLHGTGSWYVRNPYTEGVINYKLLNYASAKNNFEIAVTNLRKSHCDQNKTSEFVIALGNLGEIYKILGRNLDAVSCYMEAKEICKHGYSDHDARNIAAFDNNIGKAYALNGDREQALDYYQKSSDMLKIVHGENVTTSQDYAAVCNNQAVLYKDLSDFKQAFVYFHKVEEIHKKCYPKFPYHENTAGLYSNMGDLMMTIGLFPLAMEYIQKSVQILRRLYGDVVHPLIATGVGNLGIMHWKMGMYQKGLKMLLKQLDMDRHIFGTGPHPAIARTLNSLGVLYDQLGDSDKALDCLIRAVSMTTQIYSNEVHPHAIEYTTSLSGIYTSRREYSKALETCLQSLKMSKSIYNDVPNISTATIYNNLSEISKHLKKFEDAVKYIEVSISMKERIFGDRPMPEIAIGYNNLADTLKELKRYKESQFYYEKGLAMMKTVHHDNTHPQVMNIVFNLASLHYQLKHYEQSVTYLNESLESSFQRKAKGEKDVSSEILHACVSLGIVYEDWGQKQEAKHYFDRFKSEFKVCSGLAKNPFKCEMAAEIAKRQIRKLLIGLPTCE